MSIIKQFETAKEMAVALAQLIQQKAQEKAQRNEQLFLAISGGNTPKLLFDLLSKQYKTTIPWNNIRFYWVDERCVAPNNKESNYGMTKLLLFNNIEIYSSQIERIIGENEPSEEALRYSNILSSQLPHKKLLPCFDLILLGMGDDGHTASIFPDQLQLLQSEKICEVSEHPISRQKRITLTPNVINNASEIIFLVNGNNKSRILREIIKKERNYYQYPSSHIHPTYGTLTWMIDKEAAELL